MKPEPAAESKMFLYQTRARKPTDSTEAYIQLLKRLAKLELVEMKAELQAPWTLGQAETQSYKHIRHQS